MSSIKRSILSNYSSQIYVTLISIIMMPLYLKYMGAEAYGLIGFFAVIQAWFYLLDIGLTPTMSRESARFRGGGIDALSYLRLLRLMEGIFLVIALSGGLLMFGASSYIANDWLQASKLPVIEVQMAVQFMAIIFVMRWMSGLYRSVISGLEKLVWLGAYNAVISTLHFVVVLPLIIFVGATPSIFFGFLCAVAVIELMGLRFYVHRLLPVIPQGHPMSWDLTPLKPLLKFSLTIAFTSSVWILVTQIDKLILSKMLPLAEYGSFTLAVLVGNGVNMISGPISMVIMPRMAKLEAQGDHTSLIELYRKATQFVAVFAGATAITIAFCAEPLLWTFTGDRLLAHQASPVLTLYALGNGILTVSAFPYYLQYAKGDLRLHFIGNALFIILLLPSIIWATSQYGGIGAGYVWFAMNLLIFVVWLPWVHRKFETGLNLKWYVKDVLSILIPSIVVGYYLGSHMQLVTSRLLQFQEIFLTGLFVFLVGAAASSEIRGRVGCWLRLC